MNLHFACAIQKEIHFRKDCFGEDKKNISGKNMNEYHQKK
jgi:hypothetical protein